MTLKNRAELEASFKTGKRPSQGDFADLIGSLLNKRDDQFHGRWKAGSTYRAGDVVVHDHTLWEMTGDANGSHPEICSKEQPNPSSKDWSSLVIPIKDDDWILVPAGIDTPRTEGEEDKPPPAVMYANPYAVRVGIGTDAPLAVMDVRDGHGGCLLFGGYERPGPALRLVCLDGEELQHYLATWVQRYASLVTDAPDGFAFHSGDPHREFCESTSSEISPPLVAIRRDGKVGIGTGEPGTRLEVTDQTSGRFLFNLDPNPALKIVNLRPKKRSENYLATGVDNDVAEFVTDSDHGFVFRAGDKHGTDDSKIDISRGNPLCWILPHGKGKLGIGRYPADFQLDVNGLARAFGFYVDTDTNNVTEDQPLTGVLDKVCRLRPVTFKWSPSIGLDDPGAKIGLVANDVEEIFPEAVRNDNNHKTPTKAVAYDALVPVLVKAIQEQQHTIFSMETRIKDLEKRIAALKPAPESGL